MKVFFRRTKDRRIQTFECFFRFINDESGTDANGNEDFKVEFVAQKAILETPTFVNGYEVDKPVETLFIKYFDSIEAYEATFKALTKKLLSVGWKSSWKEIRESDYVTYPNGELMASKEGYYIDDLDYLFYPLKVYPQPNGIACHYTGTTVHVIDSSINSEDLNLLEEITDKLKAIYESTRIPFDFMLNEGKIIVTDIAISGVSYAYRSRLMTDLADVADVVEAFRMGNKEDLDRYLNIQPEGTRLCLKSLKGEYVHGFTKSYSYIYEIDNAHREKERIVVDVNDDEVVVVNQELTEIEVIDNTFEDVSEFDSISIDI